MVTPPLDYHFKVHNKRVREYIENIDIRIGKKKNEQIEDTIIFGLEADRARRENVNLLTIGQSNLPSIDLYSKFKINGLDVATVYNRGDIPPERLIYIYYGAVDIIKVIEEDKNCRSVIPRFKGTTY
jgi:hypothetical protein